jgi:tRNA-(ms[2]io[6]A)-hydroxylase
MLCLTYRTPPSWAEAALADMPMLLSDHYHLELKAAAMAQSMIAKWGESYPRLIAPMTRLIAEETEHAGRVDRFRKEYGVVFDPRRGNPYVRALRRRIACEGATLCDLLLTSALIEARSAERFRLIADAGRGSAPAGFYEDLYSAEVGHYVLFTELAAELFGEERTRERLAILAAHEAETARTLPAGPRIH